MDKMFGMQLSTQSKLTSKENLKYIYNSKVDQNYLKNVHKFQKEMKA